MIKSLEVPKDLSQLKSLKAGEEVRLSGTLYTARDAAHLIMNKTLKKKKKLPIDLESSVIYYCGPTPAQPGSVIGSCGPTTASRMDSFVPQLLENGLKCMIGKGLRSDCVVASVKKNRAVYFATYGGCGAYLNNCVISCNIVDYSHLGAEAIYELVVENFPVIVAIDACGRVFKNGDICR